MTDDSELCVVCRRTTPEHGHVCEADRATIARQLAGLVGQVERLEVEVTPGARRGDGVRVSTSKGAAPMPARLDALSLVGPGAAGVTAMLHPLIRHWQTTREVDVTSVRRTQLEETPGGRLVYRAEVVTERRQITEWHREVARDAAGNTIAVADDDQIGMLPPREWLQLWVGNWREQFAGQRPRWMREIPWTVQLHPRPEPAAEPAARPPGGGQAQATLALMATEPALGDRPRDDDPLSSDVVARFGVQSTSQAVANSVMYLLWWLDEICDRPGMPAGDFAGELRSMSAELSRVLGERPAQMWLGRCPARIAEHDQATSRPCGAGLWQDPHASQVQCPRCHSTWGPRRAELLQLAVEMRRTWPVDRRRLYTAEERRVVRRPRCPGCGALADVQWRDATGIGAEVQVWQPVGASCPAGCTEAEQVI